MVLITDVWKLHANDAYQSVTRHYLTKDFAVQINCPPAEYFPKNHIANNLETALEESIQKWITVTLRVQQSHASSQQTSASVNPISVPVILVEKR